MLRVAHHDRVSRRHAGDVTQVRQRTRRTARVVVAARHRADVINQAERRQRSLRSATTV